MGKKQSQQYEQLSFEGMPTAESPTPTREFGLGAVAKLLGRGTSLRRGADTPPSRELTQSELQAQNQELFASSPQRNPDPAPGSTHHHIGDQLKAFMTPKEILNEWQVLDGDRHAVSNGSVTRESDEELLARKYKEASEVSPGGQHGNNVYRRTNGDITRNPGRWVLHEGAHERVPASDKEGWYRATVPPGDGQPKGHLTYNSRRRDDSYHQYTPIEGDTLAESIRAEGIHDPIRLGLETGSKDKPQLAGAHHRLAVANQDLPDNYQPVLYHKDIGEARSPNTTKWYKYK